MFVLNPPKVQLQQVDLPYLLIADNYKALVRQEARGPIGFILLVCCLYSVFSHHFNKLTKYRSKF